MHSQKIEMNENENDIFDKKKTTPNYTLSRRINYSTRNSNLNLYSTWNSNLSLVFNLEFQFQWGYIWESVGWQLSSVGYNSLHQILLENGKPLTATSEWNNHIQPQQQY